MRILITLSLLVLLTTLQAQEKSLPSMVDVEKERPLIESRAALFARYLLEGDSVSVAAMYAKGGSIGCKKGPELLAAMGSWIRNSIKNDSRHITFKIITLSAAGELLIETGIGEGRSEKGEVKYSSQYLVVWKKEEGIWKLYRDIGL